MTLVSNRFDEVGQQRVVQLVNTTNPFDLTTRRYTEAGVRAVMSDPRVVGLPMRLLDRFGDNGIIAIVIGLLDAGRDLTTDTWLMSCRVLGRQVEQATLKLLALRADRLGADRMIGFTARRPRTAWSATATRSSASRPNRLPPDDIALKPRTTAADIEGWDSFAQIEIILAARERFGAKLTTVEIDPLRRVGDLARAIATKVA